MEESIELTWANAITLKIQGYNLYPQLFKFIEHHGSPYKSIDKIFEAEIWFKNRNNLTTIYPYKKQSWYIKLYIKMFLKIRNFINS